MSTETSRPAGTTSAAELAGLPAAELEAPRQRRNVVFVVAGLFVCFLLAGFISGFASSSPDGLEKVATDKGFIQATDKHAFANLPIAHYAVDGIDNERVAGGIAGVIGVTITFLIGGLPAFAVIKLRPGARSSGSPRSR